MFESAQLIGPRDDSEAPVFFCSRIQSEHDAYELWIEEFLVMVSVVLVILPASRVRFLLHAQMVEVAESIVEELLSASYDSRTSAIRTVDIVGQPASVDQPRSDSLVSFVIVAVFLNLGSQLWIRFGEFYESIDVRPIEGALDDQVSILMEGSDLFGCQFVQGEILLRVDSFSASVAK